MVEYVVNQKDNNNDPRTRRPWKRTDLPFYELVVFADNEGTIGPATCAKLAKDFEQWSSWAHGSGDDWFIRLYDEFKQAFKDAANNGAVEFH